MTPPDPAPPALDAPSDVSLDGVVAEIFRMLDDNLQTVLGLHAGAVAAVGPPPLDPGPEPPAPVGLVGAPTHPHG